MIKNQKEKALLPLLYGEINPVLLSDVKFK